MTSVPDPDETPPSAVEDLLVACLEHLEREGAPGLERFLREHPAHEASLRQHLARLWHLGLKTPEAATEHPQKLGDFTLLEPIGQGGMGVVYRARQESLGREVAVKVVRPDQLFFPGARERFRREVEAVARLQHPGIVKVHTVGGGDEVPYFAMELVRGATLARLIEHFAASGHRPRQGHDLLRALVSITGEAEPAQVPVLFDGPWIEVAVRVARELAETLEHAHRRGVVHRDVKPSNVMLTSDGRVLLLDFGLASAHQAERLTRSGAALGSLAYMPPEVLAGVADHGDPRADVYSLGVTLWELLALRLPYQHSDPVILRAQIATGVRPPLAGLLPGMTWEVETVLGTALEPDRQRRYASASLLARDLDNLLARRPIEARRAGAWLRLRRWSQRHPARATAAVATVLALSVGPSLWAWQENRSRQRITAQRDELIATNAALLEARSRAEAESQRAQRNYQSALQAIDTLLAKVGDESLREIPHFELVRRDLLTAALRQHEALQREQPGGGLPFESGQLRHRVARLHMLLGERDPAREAIDQAVLELRRGGESVAVRVELARALVTQTFVQRRTSDLVGAAAAAAEAITGLQSLVAGSTDVAVAELLATARREAARTIAERGELAGAVVEAEHGLRELAAWQAAAAPVDATGSLGRVEAMLRERAGAWLQQMAASAPVDAAPALRDRAVAMLERAHALWCAPPLADDPAAGARADAAGVATNLAIALRAAGRQTEARAAYAQSIAKWTPLVHDFPAVGRWSCGLAQAHTNLAAALLNVDAPADALRELDQATAVWHRLRTSSPGADEFSFEMAHTLYTHATACWMIEPVVATCLPLVTEAHATVKCALAQQPEVARVRQLHRMVSDLAASCQLELGEHRAAAALALELVDARLAPVEPATAAALLAQCAQVAGATAEADDYLTQARRLLRAALAGGKTLDELRGASPLLARRWDAPGFAALRSEFTGSR